MGIRTYKQGAQRHAQPANTDGRLAHDIVEAALVIRTIKRLDSENEAEVRHRAVIAAITLHRAPWEDTP